MSAAIHPLAPSELPAFIGAADGSDPLFTAVTFILIFGLYLWGCFILSFTQYRNT